MASEIAKLKGILNQAKNVVVLTGAGISAESGIPTFRGPGGFWRTYKSQDLASAGAFLRSPSLVWEFYHYRRELVLTKEPNKAHEALAKAEALLKTAGRRLTIVTQNIDGLHQRAGSKEVVELHGSLYKTLCLTCNSVEVNTDSPICEALRGKGVPDSDAPHLEIPIAELPHCKNKSCNGLLRPYVVWFGENLREETLLRADEEFRKCDACLVVGTSSVVYPAAMYAPTLAANGVPVAEFNIEPTPATHLFKFHFEGPCTKTLPIVLQDIFEPTHISYSWNKLLTKQFRNFSTDVKDDKLKTDGDKVGNLSMKTKLKLAVRDYGSTVIVFHIGISLIMLGGLYAAISSGIEMNWFLEKLKLPSRSSEVAAGASTFVMAYAVNKVLAPVRFSITFACTPFIVKYLRSVGLLKSPKKFPPS